MRIFVSYTTRDVEITISLLKTISTKLEHIGYVYVDIIHNDSIDKQKRVLYELDNSDVVLLIDSPKNHLSEWIAVEIDRAKSKSVPIISFSLTELIDNSELAIFNKLSSYKLNSTSK